MRFFLPALALIAIPAIAGEALWLKYAPKAGVVRAVIFGERPADGAELGEALEDWAYYLNEFAADNPDVEVTFEPHSVCHALIAHAECDNGFSTLFLNAKGEAFFYPWSIMERQVYIHAHTALRGVEIPDYVAGFGSEAVTLK